MTSDRQRQPNRLAVETSPYLLQHAENPVDWYPWGEEAFARAKDEDKPILLSVGYSSCHWCHVMAHESFEDETTAGLMNESFVNVKVDREERPDVDTVYMAAVQVLTGQGGWPMTVFLTPELQPFFAGTYFPPADGHGRPGFLRLLTTLASAWEKDRENIVSTAVKVTEHLKEMADREVGGDVELSAEMPANAVKNLMASFDQEWGGFGKTSKFPAPGTLEFLLAFAARLKTGDELGDAAFMMVGKTLEVMATGGMYDQLGGGFARYSIDREWVVPHFEKMLYDNAQLVRLYVHVYQWKGNPLFERVARETLDYMARDLRHERGGFFSSEDADSDGGEGKFYVWSLADVERLLGKEAAFAAACLGMTGAGNFRDPHNPDLSPANVLTRRFDPEVVATRFEIEREEIEPRLEKVRRLMLDSRNERPRPDLDDKVLASWNGLALSAFSEAARVFGDETYLELASSNARFIHSEMWKDGEIFHIWKDGRAHVSGMLEDYTSVGLGLVELFKATGDVSHLEWAREIANIIGERFYDEDKGGFFETAHDSESLLVRPKGYADQTTPSGNGSAALLLAWLSRYFGESGYEEATGETIAAAVSAMVAGPGSLGTLWQAFEFLMAPRTEVVIVGDDSRRRPFEDELARFYLPWVAIAPTHDASGLKVFEGRDAGGGAQAYFCLDMACELPATTPEMLHEQLTA